MEIDAHLDDDTYIHPDIWRGRNGLLTKQARCGGDTSRSSWRPATASAGRENLRGHHHEVRAGSSPIYAVSPCCVFMVLSREYDAGQTNARLAPKPTHLLGAGCSPHPRWYGSNTRLLTYTKYLVIGLASGCMCVDGPRAFVPSFKRENSQEKMNVY